MLQTFRVVGNLAISPPPPRTGILQAELLEFGEGHAEEIGQYNSRIFDIDDKGRLHSLASAKAAGAAIQLLESSPVRQIGCILR